MTLTPTQTATLIAAINRLIPADDWPSASQAGVMRFLRELFETDRARDADQLRAGIDAINVESKSRVEKVFVDATPDQQDEILAAVEAGDVRASWLTSPTLFFRLLLNVTSEGYYGDTANHRVPQSWEMIGYDPGANRP